MAEDVYDFGVRLRQLRKRKGITQSQLGEILGVTKNAVSHYESNTQTPSIAKIVQLAIHLNTSTDYLLGLDNEPVIKISKLSPEKQQFVMDFIKYIVDE